MRKVTRITLAAMGAALTVSLAPLGVASAATTSVITHTWTLGCAEINTPTEYVQAAITDVDTQRLSSNGTIRQVDTLTAPNGTVLTYKSQYKWYTDEGGDAWTSGPRILDTDEIPPGIFYLQGNVTIGYASGGYTAGFTANHVTNVCVALGYLF